MSASQSPSEVVLALAEEFLDRYRQGERPSLKEYIDRRPDLAAEIRQVFPAMALMEKIALRDESLVGALTGDEPKPSAATPTQLGDYRILREVGRGGMGVVYEAVQESLGRHVALKMLPHKTLLDAKQRQRFEREAKAAAKLHHTNIVPVFGVGEHDGLPYYAMQFIRGLGLDAVLDDLRRLQTEPHAPVTHPAAVSRSLLTGAFRLAVDPSTDPVEPAPVEPPAPHTSDTLSLSSSVVLPGQGEGGPHRQTYWQSVALIGVQVAEALEHAHGQGVLHRDIKPSNLLLDTHGRVWLTDFGLAKAEGAENLTQSGDILGTLRYMPPEAFDGRADARSDVYSLGLTLYELLALRPAFDETERNKLVKQVMTAEPVRLDQVNRAVPRDLVTIVHKAIDRDPVRRYPTAAELAEDLKRFVEDRPIRARRVSPGERVWRWYRRNPAVARLTAAVATLLLTVAIGATVTAFSFGERANVEKRLKAIAEEKEKETSRTLIDMFTSYGLMAGERENPAQAVLWFANAVRWAEDDNERQHFNRVRAIAWQRQALQPLRALEHSAEWVQEMNWHPGGRYLRTQTVLKDLSDGDATVWDLDREAPWPLPVGVATARSAAWNADGSQLALGTATGEVVLCRFPTGEVVGRLPGTGPVRHLAFSPEGRYLALARDKTVARGAAWKPDGSRLELETAARVWDCATAAFVTEELTHPDQVTTLSFHPRGHLLVTACFDRQARVFRVARDTQGPLFSVPHHSGTRTSRIGTAFDPPVFVDEGRGLLTVGRDGVTWYDAETGVPQLVSLSEPSRVASLLGVVARPDSKYIATGGLGSAQIWNGVSRHSVSPILVHGAGQPVFSLSFSPDGRTLVTGCGDRAVRRWSVPDGKPLGKPLMHSSTVTRVLFSPDGRFLATAQRGGLTRVWALPLPDARHRRLPVEAISSLARLSRGGRYVLPTGISFRPGDLRATRAFEVATGQPAGPRLEAGGFILDGAFSPNGRQAALIVSLAPTPAARHSSPGTHPGQLQLWDWRTGERLSEPLAMPSEPRCLDYRPDGQALAIICAGGQLVLVDPGSGRVQGQWQARPDSPANGLHYNNGMVRFSPDGRSVLVFGTEDIVRVLDVATGQPRYASFQHKGLCNDVCFSPDGRLVSVASWDNTVRVWELESGQPVGDLLRHPDWVFTAPFSPDGKYLLTACRDSTARLWDWRAGREVGAFQHDHEVYAAAFTPDGRWLLTTSMDKTLRVWESVTGKQATPPLELSGFGITLGVTSDGKHVVVGGHTKNELSVFDLGDLAGDTTLDADDLVVWSELLSGQRLHKGSSVTNLTADEWLQRWRDFHKRYPDFSKLEPAK